MHQALSNKELEKNYLLSEKGITKEIAVEIV